MTISEIITLIMSGVALLFSGSSFYISFFYKKTCLIGNFVAYKTDFDDYESVDCEFSFSNTGNKEVLLKDIQVNLSKWEEGDNVPEVQSLELPAVIRSGEVFLLKLSIPRYFCAILSSKQKEFSLNFNVISADGTQYVASLNLQPMIVDEEGSVSFHSDSLEKPFLIKAI